MTICGDYFIGFPGLIPPQAGAGNCDAIKDRWVQRVYSMDLTPEPGDDELGRADGAWSAWDLPVNVAAQIDDETGQDLITVAIDNRIYILDFERFQDEWNWEVFGPIRRRVEFGPIPAIPEEVDGHSNARNAYRLDWVKRLREFAFNLASAPTDAASKYRITSRELDAPEQSGQQSILEMRQRNRVKLATQGLSFVVRIEHEANEQFDPTFFMATWHPLGPRVRYNAPPEDA